MSGAGACATCKAWEVRKLKHQHASTTNVDLDAVYIAINQDLSKAKQSKAKQSKARQSKPVVHGVLQRYPIGQGQRCIGGSANPSASVESGAELSTKIEKAVNDECAALDLGENAAHRKGKITMLDTFEDESIMQVARIIGRHGSRCA